MEGSIEKPLEGSIEVREADLGLDELLDLLSLTVPQNHDEESPTQSEISKPSQTNFLTDFDTSSQNEDDSLSMSIRSVDTSLHSNQNLANHNDLCEVPSQENYYGDDSQNLEQTSSYQLFELSSAEELSIQGNVQMIHDHDDHDGSNERVKFGGEKYNKKNLLKLSERSISPHQGEPSSSPSRSSPKFQLLEENEFPKKTPTNHGQSVSASCTPGKNRSFHYTKSSIVRSIYKFQENTGSSIPESADDDDH